MSTNEDKTLIVAQLRRLNIDDLPAVVEIERASFHEPWSEDAYRHELSTNPIARYWGVFLQDQLVGFAGYWLILDEGHISNVAVHPDARGKGLSKLLMAAIISECRLSEGRRMTLEVRESNTTAQNLYIKFGFSVAGKRPGYYSDNNETALIMWAYITDLDVQKVLN
jgi:ribosomal-protein-alanine N-acetyltransferase